MIKKALVYLACPYSHPDPQVRHARFIDANRCAGLLMSEGVIVFSPISHMHPIAVECELPKGWDYWERFDKAFMVVCRSLLVCCIDGWKQSTGVTAEIAMAKDFEIPVGYLLDPLNREYLRQYIRDNNVIAQEPTKL